MGKKIKVREYPITRESGYLYYVGKDGYIYKVAMARGGKKKGKK